MSTFHVRFDRLDAEKEEALLAFFREDSLLVKGTDGRPWGDFRGGCLPVLIIAAALSALPVLLEWDANPYVVIFVLTAWMGWATSRLIRTGIAHRRSRRLNDSVAWHGLAWDEDRFALRTWEDCVLVPWDDISELRYLDDRWDKGLADTLWMHMTDGRRVQIPSKEDRFAGRRLIEWFVDIGAQLEAKTGRVPVRPGPVTR